MTHDNETVSAWKERPVAAVAFVALALVIVYAMIRMLAPFITPILLAAIITTFTYPLYRRLCARLGNRREISAALMLLIVTFTVIIPASVLTLLLIQQATTLFDLIQRAEVTAVLKSIPIDDWVASAKSYIPGLELDSIKADELIVGVVERLPGWVAQYGGKLLASLTNIAIGFIFMLLASYYFYVEGETLVAQLKHLSPLPDEYENEIFLKFKGVIDATFRGQILTALAQGAVTAIGLLIAGIPGWLFWGAVAALFSLIPMVGAAAVWVPATLYLAAIWAFRDGDLFSWVFLLIWGGAVVSLIDNLIRPWAMRSGTNMSAILLFFSILGGISAFGFVGLILGPLVFALFMTIVHMYKYFFDPGLLVEEESRSPEVEKPNVGGGVESGRDGKGQRLG